MKVELDKDIRTREHIIGMRPDYPHPIEWVEEITIRSLRPGTLIVLRVPYEHMDDLLTALLEEKHRRTDPMPWRKPTP